MPGYTLEDGETLKNKLGATNVDELEKREADLVVKRDVEIRLGGGPQREFDAEHLKAIHHHLFQDVYEWAGHTRDERVALSDGSIAAEPNMRKAEGQPFSVGPAIAQGLDAFAERLREADLLRGLPREEFADRAADTMAELNGVHPFREGNGRTQRIFMSQLAEEAGHSLDFSIVSKERMVQASIAANENGDPSMMRRMFDEISDPERTAMLRGSIAQLETLNFDWNERYVATLTPGHAVDLVMAGIAGDGFMARTESAILFGQVEDLPEPTPARGETFRYGGAQQEQSVGEEADAPRDFHGEAEAIGSEAEDTLDGAAQVAEAIFESVADYSGRTIERLADDMAEILGGGSSAPKPLPPPLSARERREARIQETMQADQRQRQAPLDELKRELSREVTPEEATEIAATRGTGGRSI